ncbi:class I SAM-dependent methyltransferase, partial [Patescibacteria group bacterium]|nr:class I SAM-dependent methyltransferase [Patescibacteria group bacterium]
MKKEYAQYLVNKTKADYNLISGDFSRTRNRLWEEITFLFKTEKNEKVLDSGCGNGRYYELLKHTDYTGVDNSRELIQIARGKYPEAKFQVADALALPFPDNSFDQVYSIAVLHHIPSKELRLKFLREIKRVLKPNGKVTLTAWKFHQKKERRLLIKYTILKIIGISKLDFMDILEPWGKETYRY